MSSGNLNPNNEIETDKNKLTLQTEQENENQNNEMEEKENKAQETETNDNKTLDSKKIIIIISIIALIFLILAIVFLILYVEKDEDNDETTEFDIKEQNVKSTSGQNIYGKIYIPKKKNSYTVILCHGFGGTHEDMVDYAEYLAEYGYVTYIFDFRGGSPNSKSDGETYEMTPLTEKQDLSDVYEFLVKQDYTTKGKIYLIGNSQGGFVSTLYAADNKDNIAGLLLLFPALVIPENMRNEFSNLDEVPDRIDNYLGLMTIGKAYVESVYNIDAYEYLKGYDKQVIILHGIEDYLVPYTSSVRACQNYGTTCRVILYEGGDHGLNPEVPRKKSLQDTLHFFNDLIDGVF